VEAESIELTSEQNVLTIAAERRFEVDDADQVVAMERPQGAFSRQLFLSESLDSEQIQATYDKGVLTLEIPVAERAKPRKIEIGGSGDGPKTIDGSSTPA
jgi:HSP20 family protein